MHTGYYYYLVCTYLITYFYAHVQRLDAYIRAVVSIFTNRQSTQDIIITISLLLLLLFSRMHIISPRTFYAFTQRLYMHVYARSKCMPT